MAWRRSSVRARLAPLHKSRASRGSSRKRASARMTADDRAGGAAARRRPYPKSRSRFSRSAAVTLDSRTPTGGESGKRRATEELSMYAHPSRLLAVAVAALYMSITVAGSASAATTNVDAQSLAGPCSDIRTALEAENPATPWCSLSKALTTSPDGSSIVVRRGTYPATAVSGRHLVTGIAVQPFAGEQPVVTSLSLKQSDRFAISGLTLQSVQLDTAASISLTGNEIT